jgi:hypothetical protein
MAGGEKTNVVQRELWKRLGMKEAVWAYRLLAQEIVEDKKAKKS